VVNETLINIIMMNKLALFLIIAGISGLVFNRLYIIQALISFEVILLGLNYLIILYAIQYKLLSNQIPSLLLLAVAAAEVAVGLGLVVILYKKTGQVSFTDLKVIRG